MNTVAIKRKTPSPRLRGTMDASLYDSFATKYGELDLVQMVRELRGWSTDTPPGQSVAAMARLLDLSIMSETLTELERRRAARLAVVIEQIVRNQLHDLPDAVATVEGAYRLLLQFGEVYSPCTEVVSWVRTERQRQGLPPIA